MEADAILKYATYHLLLSSDFIKFVLHSTYSYQNFKYFWTAFFKDWPNSNDWVVATLRHDMFASIFAVHAVVTICPFIPHASITIF